MKNNMIIPARLAVQEIFTLDFKKIRQRVCRLSVSHLYIIL